jgi:tetratricopeptide (TPR) repeat protein
MIDLAPDQPAVQLPGCKDFQPIMLPELAAAADHLAAHRYADARRICERLLAERPDDPDVLHVIGLTRFREGDEEGGIDALTRSLELRPESADVLANLAQMQFELGHYEAAHACFMAALDLAPEDYMLKYRVGQTLFRAENYAGAEAAYREVLKQAPDFIPAHYDLALILAARDDIPGAIASYDEAARRDPAELDARSRATNLRQTLCDWAGLDRVRAEIIVPALRPGFASERPPVPLEMLRLPIALSPAEFHRITVNFARAHELVARPMFKFPPPPPGGARRLKIGYVSADFGDHPVGHIVSGLFGHHDRSRIEAVAYALTPDDGGPERRQLASAVERMVDLSPLTRREAARRIHADGIDVLVDLSGHTRGNGLEIFARRPAPVQATWLGFPGTLGTDFMDYLLADPIIAPAEEQPYYTERLVQLRSPYFALAPQDPGPAPPRAALGLPERGFVFAAFSLAHKIEPQAFGIWMRLLAKTPGSVLWLRVDNAAAQANLRREAAARGVAPERLIFAPRLPRRDHLARQRGADLYLDTFFYGGHSTVADMLACGVPAVTAHGDRFAARVGASLLTSVGLDDLVAPSPEAYESIALRLASDPTALSGARTRLADRKASAALFDAAGFVRRLETAYHTMWDTYAAGRAPQPFAVAA